MLNISFVNLCKIHVNLCSFTKKFNILCITILQTNAVKNSIFIFNIR